MCMCSATVVLRVKGENCDGTDFDMEVAATLPERSEWTLHRKDFFYLEPGWQLNNYLGKLYCVSIL